MMHRTPTHATSQLRFDLDDMRAWIMVVKFDTIVHEADPDGPTRSLEDGWTKWVTAPLSGFSSVSVVDCGPDHEEMAAMPWLPPETVDNAVEVAKALWAKVRELQGLPYRNGA